MSAFIGSVKGPNHNSERTVADVWCGLHHVEIRVVDEPGVFALDPIAARNFAALLVRASEEVERMRARSEAGGAK